MGRHHTRPATAPSLCRRCGSPRVVDFAAEVVCSNCGCVMQADTPDPEPDHEPELRFAALDASDRAELLGDGG